LPVLLFADDGQICALALELDVLAYGKTEAEALEALSGVILGQFAAALYFGDTEVAAGTVLPEYESRYRAARRREVFQGLPPVGDRAVELPVPSAATIREYAADLEVEYCPAP
jgi:hypothetical protein